jgi:hypothetical protein
LPSLHIDHAPRAKLGVSLSLSLSLSLSHATCPRGKARRAP